MDNKNTKYIAHLDILGMTTIVKKDLDEAWGMLSDLVAAKDKLIDHEIKFVGMNEKVKIWEQIQTVTFSDTIILFTKNNTPIELQSIIILITEIFHKELYHCIPIRVGLSVGEFYFNSDKSMYVGPALIEAYHTGEGAQWLGITLGESVYEEVLKLKMKSRNSDLIVNWNIPLKKENKNSYVINWPITHDLKIEAPISVEQFYQAFQNTFGIYNTLPEDVKLKYINTVEFLNYQLNKIKNITNQRSQ